MSIATERNGRVLPNHTRKPKIKREDEPTGQWQSCAGCGGTFFSVYGRSHCHVCRPASLAEIAVHHCAAPGCTEIIGAELEYCQQHAEPLFGDKAPEPAARHSPVPTQLTVAHDQIEPDPDQPRKEFDDVELAKLAKSLQDEGQLVPLIVNVVHGDLGQPRYRIIEGERRWRAAKIAGLAELRVEAHDLDRQDVMRLQGIANLLRRDLNPIEEARWCKRMCQATEEGGGGLTQEQLAERLGVTQAEISNRIRVLRAPQWALDLVISGQMSRKHATALLQYEGSHVLSAIEKDVKGDLKREGGLAPAETWSRALHTVVRNATKSLSDAAWTSDYKRVEFEIDPDALEPAEREELRLIEVPDWSGRKEWRAQNEKLAQQLLDKAKRAAIAKAEKKGKKQAAGSRQQAVELTPAEKKRREKERADEQRKRLGEWYHDWLRVLCAGRMLLGTPVGTKVVDGVGWLALWALLEQPESQYDAPDRFAELASVKYRSTFRGRIHEVLAELSPSSADEAMRKWTIGLLIDDQGHARRHGGGMAVVPDGVVRTLAALLKLDVAAAWRDDRSSAMRERYWNLHDKDGLTALGKELKVPLAEGKTKSAMVAILCGQQRPLAMPKELAALATKKAGGQ